MSTTEEAKNERRELVFQEYERSLDLELAMTLVPMSEKDREDLRNDDELRARIAIADARVRAEIIMDYRTLAKETEKDGVKATLLTGLGKMFYKKRFVDVDDGSNREPLRVLVEFVEPKGQDARS